MVYNTYSVHNLYKNTWVNIIDDMTLNNSSVHNLYKNT